MSKEKLNRLEDKKRSLEQELSRIQGDLDQSIDAVKEGVSDSLDPKKIVRKHPLPVFGAAVFVGFLLGGGGNSGRGGRRGGSSDSIGSVIGNELKHQLTKRALSVLMDLIDQKIDEIRPQDRD